MRETRELHAYLGGVSARLDCPPVIVMFGGTLPSASRMREAGMTRFTGPWLASNFALRLSDFTHGLRRPRLMANSSLPAHHIPAARMRAALPGLAYSHHCAQFIVVALRKHAAEYDANHLWDS